MLKLLFQFQLNIFGLLFHSVHTFLQTEVLLKNCKCLKTNKYLIINPTAKDCLCTANYLDGDKVEIVWFNIQTVLK